MKIERLYRRKSAARAPIDVWALGARPVYLPADRLGPIVCVCVCVRACLLPIGRLGRADKLALAGQREQIDAG